MTSDSKELVPVWTLAAGDVDLPNLFRDGDMTPARLAELRTVLAALSKAPIATLEVHRELPSSERGSGIALQAASPLARQLAELVSQTVKQSGQSTGAGAAVSAASSGEVLYRMVVPAKVAAQVGKGLVKPMTSKTVAGGVYSGMRDGAGIVANAAFVPVATQATSAGASAAAAGAGVAGVAGAAGGTAAAAGAITIAAPLVLMAVAVGVSAYAESQRQASIDRITDLLEKLHEDNLDKERLALAGCRDAIDKATSILLDKGKIGVSLGLDSASYAISTAIDTAENRSKQWRMALQALPTGPVELAALEKAFPGVLDGGGAFRTQMEIARLAITLKRRVLILQAVEHAQQEDGANPFTNFVNALQEDERRVDQLEESLSTILVDLSHLELKRQTGLRAPVFTANEVDRLLQASYKLRRLSEATQTTETALDVAIDIRRNRDGSLIVYPALAIESPDSKASL